MASKAQWQKPLTWVHAVVVRPKPSMGSPYHLAHSVATPNPLACAQDFGPVMGETTPTGKRDSRKEVSFLKPWHPLIVILRESSVKKKNAAKGKASSPSGGVAFHEHVEHDHLWGFWTPAKAGVSGCHTVALRTPLWASGSIFPGCSG